VSDKLTISLPLPLLNRRRYACTDFRAGRPVTGNHVVLAPAGEPASKLSPQGVDCSVGIGEWVWLLGTSGTYPVNDSTPSRTLWIRLESPVTSARVTLMPEAVRLTTAGWLLVDDELPAPDTTKLISRPGTAFMWYRTDAIIVFKEGVPDSAKQAVFAETGIHVLGVTSDGFSYVRIPDTGSWTAYRAYFNSLNTRPEVEVAQSRNHTVVPPTPGLDRSPDRLHRFQARA